MSCPCNSLRCAKGCIYIGNRALIGHNYVIATLNHDMDSAKRANPLSVPVHIGAGAWLGSNVTVLTGLTIGEGAVVAAGAAVTRDVAPRTVVGGVPARVIKELQSNAQKLQASKTLLVIVSV